MMKLDDTSRAQPVEDEFVNKFCMVYMLWVHKGVDIFKTMFDDTDHAYDSTERFALSLLSGAAPKPSLVFSCPSLLTAHLSIPNTGTHCQCCAD